jgi:hypothetical protein
MLQLPVTTALIVIIIMNNEVNEVGEYLFHHLLLRLFCWKKLGGNEVFTTLSLTAMGLTRNPLP